VIEGELDWWKRFAIEKGACKKCIENSFFGVNSTRGDYPTSGVSGCNVDLEEVYKSGMCQECYVKRNAIERLTE